MNRRRIVLFLVIFIGLILNLVIYSIITTQILYMMGSHGGVLYFLFIPYRVYNVSSTGAFLAQFIGIITGLLVSALPIRVLEGRWVDVRDTIFNSNF